MTGRSAGARIEQLNFNLTVSQNLRRERGRRENDVERHIVRTITALPEFQHNVVDEESIARQCVANMKPFGSSGSQGVDNAD